MRMLIAGAALLAAGCGPETATVSPVDSAIAECVEARYTGQECDREAYDAAWRDLDAIMAQPAWRSREWHAAQRPTTKLTTLLDH